jgi:hypothetical protein
LVETRFVEIGEHSYPIDPMNIKRILKE